VHGKPFPVAGGYGRQEEKRGSDNGIKRENNMALLSRTRQKQRGKTKKKQRPEKANKNSSFYVLLSGIKHSKL